MQVTANLAAASRPQLLSCRCVQTARVSLSLLASAAFNGARPRRARRCARTASRWWSALPPSRSEEEAKRRAGRHAGSDYRKVPYDLMGIQHEHLRNQSAGIELRELASPPPSPLAPSPRPPPATTCPGSCAAELMHEGARRCSRRSASCSRRWSASCRWDGLLTSARTRSPRSIKTVRAASWGASPCPTSSLRACVYRLRGRRDLSAPRSGDGQPRAAACRPRCCGRLLFSIAIAEGLRGQIIFKSDSVAGEHGFDPMGFIPKYWRPHAREDEADETQGNQARAAIAMIAVAGL